MKNPTRKEKSKRRIGGRRACLFDEVVRKGLRSRSEKGDGLGGRGRRLSPRLRVGVRKAGKSYFEGAPPRRGRTFRSRWIGKRTGEVSP